MMRRDALRSMRGGCVRIGCAVIALAVGVTAPAHAQRRITLEEAITMAQTTGPRARIARADSAAAAARLATAKALLNPSLSLGYSKSPPPYHIEIEQSFEFPWIRRSRIEAARISADAAALGIAIEGARLRYDVEAAYANASIANAISALSAANARDGDELVRIAIARRDAGDAADLDVDLARVTAAGLHRTASVDSLTAIVAAIELQSAIGLNATSVDIVAADSFAVMPLFVAGAAAGSLAVRQAELESQAAAASLNATQRGARFSEIAIRAGVETGDPDMKGLLPTIGFSIPLPIFDQRKGPIAEARAERDRAAALLDAARLSQSAGIAVAERQRSVQQHVLEQDRIGLEDARRVAARALTAYREGEYTLIAVLEAQRSARDALRQYYEDMGSLWLAQAAYKLAMNTGVKP